MAQNITLLGASYSAVPAVTLPKTGGGTARFDDASVTTAVAGDVAQGKIFLAADGTPTEGTNSGGGGASNFVHGTFTASETTGSVNTVTIPYTGTGYPVAAIVVVKGGAYVSGTTWYTSAQRYAIGQWTYSKSNISTTPTYATSGGQNQGVTTWIYKNTSSTSYSRSSAMNTNVLSSAAPTGAGATCVRFQNRTTLRYFVASTSYGLLAGLEYEYFIAYSS